ncbi:MAG: CHASE2 domain-containing protein [Burkholderiales bacterium]|nr:CHASE2 domain-containing protein [Burkholderiales bacterium]
MRALVWFLSLICLVLPAHSWAESVFVPVFIDARTEAKLGPFPYDRTVYADALIAFEKLGAKGIVLKFFIDQPKGNGDEALAAAMTKLPVILQARCDDTEANPNPLDARLSVPVTIQMKFAVTCSAGWIPLPRLQKSAANVCFIDQAVADAAPMLERYQNRAVKSLYVCALELARKPVRVADAGGTRKVGLAKAPRLDVISLVDVVDGKIDRARIAGKIIVFGYDGAKASMFDTAIGRISAHRVFMANLLALEMVGK